MCSKSCNEGKDNVKVCGGFSRFICEVQDMANNNITQHVFRAPRLRVRQTIAQA